MSSGLQIFPSTPAGYPYNVFQGNPAGSLYGGAFFSTLPNVPDEFDIDGPGAPGNGFPGLNLPGFQGAGMLFSPGSPGSIFARMFGLLMDLLFRILSGFGIGQFGADSGEGQGNNWRPPALLATGGGSAPGSGGGYPTEVPPYTPPAPEKGNGVPNNGAPGNGAPQMGSGTQFTSEELIQHFMSKGFTRAGAIGIVANLQAESGLRTDGPTGGQAEEGLAQWKGARLEKLKQYAASHGLDWRSKDAQLGYLDEELANDYPGVYSQVKVATNAEDAAQIFCAGFEIPTMDDGTPNYATYTKRREIAAQLAAGG